MSQEPLHLLCIEPGFPGRLGAVADWLVDRRGYRCDFFCTSAAPRQFWPRSVGRGLTVVTYPVGGVARESAAHWTRLLERGLCYAYGAWESLTGRRQPPVDVVLGRSAGLGSTLFVPSWQPRVPVVNFVDNYLPPRAHDLADDAGPETPAEFFRWRQASHAVELLDLENGVTPWAPTPWQRDLLPDEYRPDVFVAFDGVDPRRFRRDRPARSVAGRVIPEGTRVVSFVAGSLDRVRGFDRFAALADRLLRERPDVLCVAAGSPLVTRGLDFAFYGKDYPAHLAAARPPHDPDRFLVLGPVAPPVVAELLSASDLHVVPGRTHPVARSTAEAMAAGCVILAWDTAPVREFLTHGETALLADPSDPDAAARFALAALDDPAAHRPLGESAAAKARHHLARDVTLPALAGLFSDLASRER